MLEPIGNTLSQKIIVNASDMHKRKPERDHEHSPLDCRKRLIEPERRARNPYQKPIPEPARSAEKKDRPARAEDDCSLRQEAHASLHKLHANCTQN